MLNLFIVTLISKTCGLYFIKYFYSQICGKKNKKENSQKMEI